MKKLDEMILNEITDRGFESVTFVGANERSLLTRTLKGLGIEVDSVDSDPKFDNPRDAVFDDIDFNEVVVVFNAEKHFPIGQIHKGNFIIIGDNEHHNGDCNPITCTSQLVEQNKIKKHWFNYEIEKTNGDRWFIVGGSNED